MTPGTWALRERLERCWWESGSAMPVAMFVDHDGTAHCSWYLSPWRSRWIDCGTETERQQERAFPCGPRLRTVGKRFAKLKTVGVNPPRRTVGDMTMASERTLGGADHSSRSTGSGKNTLPRRHWPSLPWWGRETSPCHKRSCKDLRSPLRSARTKR